MKNFNNEYNKILNLGSLHEEIIKEPISKLDLIVDSIEYVKEGKYNFLNIVLDRVNGIDLDTIVEATNIINPILVISDGWNCPNKGNLIHLLAPFTSIPSFGTKTKRRITTENT